jgi:ABC-type transport system substrate-binding protein
MTSFVFEAFRPHPRVNQLIISSSADATFLNPILAQDAASSEVNSFIFNGLIKYNRNLDGFVRDLAESWDVEVGPEPVITFFPRKGILFISYRNPEVDRLLVEGRKEYNQEKIKKIYWRIHELIAEDQPYTFLFVPLDLSVLKKKFALLEKAKTGREIFRPIRMEKAGLFYDITKWYVPKQGVTEK